MRFDCMAIGLVGADRHECGWYRPSLRALTRRRALQKAAHRAEAQNEFAVVVVSRRGMICGHVIRSEIHSCAPDLVDLLAHAVATRASEDSEFEFGLDHEIEVAGADRDLDLDFDLYGLRR